MKTIPELFFWGCAPPLSFFSEPFPWPLSFFGAPSCGFPWGCDDCTGAFITLAIFPSGPVFSTVPGALWAGDAASSSGFAGAEGFCALMTLPTGLPSFV